MGGTTQAEVLHNFGREDRLGTAGLVASINRYLGEDGADASVPADVTASVSIGAVWLLEGLWRQSEIDRALVLQRHLACLRW
ncbi:hypothetical protein ACIG87_24025 [Micromonospora sp. NPDC051925]|uniref:hypothetical protein n=1 Tax=Micromonospora sp. NPDC051925 TaxID=3364288 RepID=UPI0037C723D4